MPPVSAGTLLAGSSGAGRSQPDQPQSLAPGWRVVTVGARQELVLLLREPVAVFFSLAFPMIMYIFIGIPYASNEVAPA